MWLECCIFRSAGPIDIEHFRSLLVENACEHAEEKLLSSWYPHVIGLFSSPKSVGSASGITRHGSTASSKYYECVDTLLGNQLRGMLSRTIEQYLLLFRAENTTRLPQFKLQLCLEGKSMEFFPSMSELESAILCLVDTVANAMSNVSTIEVSICSCVQSVCFTVWLVQGWLSGASPCPTVVVGVDPALVSSAMATLKEALSRNLQGPLEYLHLYSERHAYLVCVEMSLILLWCVCREV